MARPATEQVTARNLGSVQLVVRSHAARNVDEHHKVQCKQSVLCSSGWHFSVHSNTQRNGSGKSLQVEVARLNPLLHVDNGIVLTIS